MLIKWNLGYLFLISLGALLLFPSLHLLFFAPFLIIVLYRRPLYPSLWIACAAGLANDLLTSSSFLGLSSAIYVVATFILYRYKHHFYVDNLSTLFIMTLLFALLASLLYSTTYFLLGRLHLSFTFILTDLLIMPLLDALYGFLIFTFPLYAYKQILPLIQNKVDKKL